MARLFLRASKSVATGSLVFSKIHAPLTLSGRRSMALQLSQWFIIQLAPCTAVLGEFSIDTAGMALDDDVEVECAVGRGHRLYSDRGPLECPCHWPAVRVVQVAWALQTA